MPHQIWGREPGQNATAKDSLVVRQEGACWVCRGSCRYLLFLATRLTFMSPLATCQLIPFQYVQQPAAQFRSFLLVVKVITIQCWKSQQPRCNTNFVIHHQVHKTISVH